MTREGMRAGGRGAQLSSPVLPAREVRCPVRLSPPRWRGAAGTPMEQAEGWAGVAARNAFAPTSMGGLCLFGRPVVAGMCVHKHVSMARDSGALVFSLFRLLGVFPQLQLFSLVRRGRRLPGLPLLLPPPSA